MTAQSGLRRDPRWQRDGPGRQRRDAGDQGAGGRERRVVSLVGLLHPGNWVANPAGRESLLADLWAWCTHPDPVPVRLITAPAGYGKTWLALRLAEYPVDPAWQVRRVDPGTEARAEEMLRDRSFGGRLLLVVDDAEAREPRRLADLLAQLERHRDAAGQVRVLLLARTEGQWWRNLARAGGRHERLVSALTATARIVRLPAALDGTPQRLVSSAAEEFARQLRHRRPRRIPSEFPLETPPLDLLLTTLHAVLAANEPSPDEPSADEPTAIGLGRERAIESLLDHETRYWAERARHPPAGPPLLPPVGDPQGRERRWLRTLVAVALLFGTHTPAEAADLVRRTAGSSLAEAQVQRWGAWLTSLYPDSTEGCAGRCGMPSAIAETLVVRVLGSLTGEQIRQLAQGVSPAQAIRALRLLGGAPADNAAIEGLIDLLIRADPFVMTGAVIVVAREFPDRYPRRLAVELPEARLTHVQLDDLNQRIPYPALELAGPAVAITTLLHRLGDAPLPDRARRASSHARRLAEFGRSDDALEVCGEAVALHRQRRRVDDDRDLHLPDLAATLELQAELLARAGRRDEARASMIRAITVRRSLVGRDRATNQPHLAAAITKHARLLAESGRNDQATKVAEQAAALSRELAARDREAYLPTLATTTSDHAAFLARQGSLDEALAASSRAVTIYRELVERSRLAYLPELAAAVGRQATILGRMGRHDEELVASAEAVAYHEHAAERLGDERLVAVATAWQTHAWRLDGAQLTARAVAFSDRAVAQWRELASNDRETHLPRLARSLHEHARVLARLGQDAESMEHALEAVATFRRLIIRDPGTYEPDLANSIRFLAEISARSRRHDEAMRASHEAVGLYRDLASRDGERFRPILARSLHNHALRLARAGERDRSLALSREAVDRCRQLAERDLDTFTPDLAAALWCSGNVRARLSDQLNRTELQLGIEAVKEAITIYTGLARSETTFSAHIIDARKTLTHLNRALGMAKPDQAPADPESGWVSQVVPG